MSMTTNDMHANLITNLRDVEEIIINCKVSLCMNPNEGFSENVAALLLLAKKHHEALVGLLPF